MFCPICNRPLTGKFIQEHHLIPRTFKGHEVIKLHKICHQKIHSSITERELAKYYHTIDRLLEHEEIQKFIKWVSNKPIDFYDKSDDTKIRHSKRRR
jgi:hypothetical protein